MIAPNLILCEGEDDVDVVLHLLGRHGFRRAPVREEAGSGFVLSTARRDLVQLRRAGGYDSLRSNLRLFLHPDLQRLGVVIDADNHVGQRWQSLMDLFERMGYSERPDPDESGVVLREPGLPVLGAWVMPDNLSTGALEQFLLHLMPSGDSLWAVARDSVEALPEGLRRFRPQHQSKAQLRTWLAWQEEPGLPVGMPITRGWLSSQAPTALRFVQWVRRLLATDPLPES